MALSKTIQASSGLTAPNAYIRVGAILRLSKTTGSADVHYFADPGQAIPFDTNGFEFAYDLSGPDPFEQAYLHLKSLPEFADATDC